MTRTTWLMALTLVGSAGAAAAQGDYAIEVGAEFSRGDYGTGSDTDIWSLPITLSYGAESWGWAVSVPWLVVRGTGDVVPSGATVVRPGRGAGGGAGAGGGIPATSARVTTESGLGDMTVRGSVRLREETDALPWVGLSAKAKLATADETRNLGTGENDYALQLELAKGPLDGYLGYRLLGDPPGTDFDNTVYGGVAVSFETGAHTLMGLDFYTEQAALADADDAREASLFFVHRLDAGRRLKGYVLTGFSDASPDWGAGLSLSQSF